MKLKYNIKLSSLLSRQPLVDPGLLKKLCPFVSVEGGLLPILEPDILMS